MSGTDPEQVRKINLDRVVEKLHTAERERDEARNQRNESAWRYHHDMQVMCDREQLFRSRIGELEEQVKQQRALLGLAGFGFLAVWLGKKR